MCPTRMQVLTLKGSRSRGASRRVGFGRWIADTLVILKKLTGLLPAGSSLCPYITLRSGSLRQRQDLNDGNALSYGMAMYRGLLYSVGKRYSSASPVNLSSRRSRTKAGERKLFA